MLPLLGIILLLVSVKFRDGLIDDVVCPYVVRLHQLGPKTPKSPAFFRHFLGRGSDNVASAPSSEPSSGVRGAMTSWFRTKINEINPEMALDVPETSGDYIAPDYAFESTGELR
jgi:hypothetical protein